MAFGGTIRYISIFNDGAYSCWPKFWYQYKDDPSHTGMWDGRNFGQYEMNAGETQVVDLAERGELNNADGARIIQVGIDVFWGDDTQTNSVTFVYGKDSARTAYYKCSGGARNTSISYQSVS